VEVLLLCSVSLRLVLGLVQQVLLLLITLSWLEVVAVVIMLEAVVVLAVLEQAQLYQLPQELIIQLQ
jgi:hypothetical protein